MNLNFKERLGDIKKRSKKAASRLRFKMKQELDAEVIERDGWTYLSINIEPFNIKPILKYNNLEIDGTCEQDMCEFKLNSEQNKRADAGLYQIIANEDEVSMLVEEPRIEVSQFTPKFKRSDREGVMYYEICGLEFELKNTGGLPEYIKKFILEFHDNEIVIEPQIVSLPPGIEKSLKCEIRVEDMLPVLEKYKATFKIFNTKGLVISIYSEELNIRGEHIKQF